MDQTFPMPRKKCQVEWLHQQGSYCMHQITSSSRMISCYLSWRCAQLKLLNTTRRLPPWPRIRTRHSPVSHSTLHATMPPSALMPVPAGAAKEQFCKSTSAFLLSHATCTHASAFSHLKVIPVILTLEAFTTIAGTPSLLTEAPGSPVIRMGPCDCVMTTPPLTFPCVQYRSEIGGR